LAKFLFGAENAHNIATKVHNFIRI